VPVFFEVFAKRVCKNVQLNFVISLWKHVGIQKNPEHIFMNTDIMAFY
jgi:hypothetical protein